MESNSYQIPCGYFNCDTRFEFCSRGFVTPECLSCSGMCSHYRIVNDPVATARCQSLCPEYWQQTHSISSIESTTEITQLQRFSENMDILIIVIFILVAIILFFILISFGLIFGRLQWKRIKLNRAGYQEATTFTLNGALPSSRNDVTGRQDPETPPVPQTSAVLPETETAATSFVMAQTTAPGNSAPVLGNTTGNGQAALPVCRSSLDVDYYVMAEDLRSEHVTEDSYTLAGSSSDEDNSAQPSAGTDLQLDLRSISSDRV